MRKHGRSGLLLRVVFITLTLTVSTVCIYIYATQSHVKARINSALHDSKPRISDDAKTSINVPPKGNDTGEYANANDSTDDVNEYDVNKYDVESLENVDVNKLLTRLLYGNNNTTNYTNKGLENDANKAAPPDEYKVPTPNSLRPIYVRIYKENDVYDKYGLRKTGNNSTNDTMMDVIESAVIESDKEVIIVPPTIKPMDDKTNVDRGSDATSGIQASDGSQNVDAADNVILGKETRNVFINCEETFSLSAELFMKTYPNSHNFLIVTFFVNRSYDLLNLRHSNTMGLLVPAFASDYNMTSYVAVLPFGSTKQVNMSVEYIDIASWIMENMDKGDNIILRIDSDREQDIVKRLIETTAIEYVDKYYSSDEKFAERLAETDAALEVRFWDIKNMTYSDMSDMYKQPGDKVARVMEKCDDKARNGSVTLLLYSRYGSTNALNVIDVLWKSWEILKHLYALYVPGDFIQRHMSDIRHVFHKFDVGIVYAADPYSALPEINQLRNEVLYARNLFKREKMTLSHVFMPSFVNSSEAMLTFPTTFSNISFILPGRDITHLIPKVVTGDLIAEESIGVEAGDFLTIDIDATYSEYLVFYIVQRYAQTLISLADCH